MSRPDIFTVWVLILTVVIMAIAAVFGSPELGYVAVAVGGLVAILTLSLRRGDE